MRAYERFLNYVTVCTESAENQERTPSTPGQWDLAELLVKELKEIGMENPGVNEYCIVTAWLPATPGRENSPALGLLAHMDTSCAFPGLGVHPVLHENYDGGDLVLPKENRIIRSEEFPFLQKLIGHTLITADGSTLLGADDKAGIAEIMTLCEEVIQNRIPHGRICVAFTPDEEIGEGPDHFDVNSFGAEFAYTVDGDLAGGIEYENFNAASAEIRIHGVSVHPGSAKNVMENALLLAQELNGMLPPDEIPARTSGYEGFFHLIRLEGDPAYAEMSYLIRDHDRVRFEEKKHLLEKSAERIRKAHPAASLELSIRDSYYNMQEKIQGCMHLVDNARRAAEMAGVPPEIKPIRGGTDGSRLSFMGLPCPNLGTGGENFHGPYELVSVQSMDQVVEILKNIVILYSAGRSGDREEEKDPSQ